MSADEKEFDAMREVAEVVDGLASEVASRVLLWADERLRARILEEKKKDQATEMSKVLDGLTGGGTNPFTRKGPFS